MQKEEYSYEDYYTYEYIGNFINRIIIRRIWYDGDIEEFSRIFKYDENGNEIYSTDSRYNYDDEIKCEIYSEYDDQNRIISRSGIYNAEYKKEIWEYDKNNNVIHYLDSTCCEKWFEYDDQNRLIYYNEDSRIIIYPVYDTNGNRIFDKNPHGEIVEEYKYDENENKIYCRDKNGREEFYEYDDNNKLIYIKSCKTDTNNSIFSEESFRYDKSGNCIYHKFNYNDLNIDEEWYRYDDKNNLIYYKLYGLSYYEEE